RESVKAPGWASLMTLLSDTAYRSFVGEVEALNTTTIRRLTWSRRHQLLGIAPSNKRVSMPPTQFCARQSSSKRSRCCDHSGSKTVEQTELGHEVRWKLATLQKRWRGISRIQRHREFLPEA